MYSVCIITVFPTSSSTPIMLTIPSGQRQPSLPSFCNEVFQEYCWARFSLSLSLSLITHLSLEREIDYPIGSFLAISCILGINNEDFWAFLVEIFMNSLQTREVKGGLKCHPLLMTLKTKKFLLEQAFWD